MRLPALRWPQLYYAATLLFAAADWFAGANLRAVGFAAWPELRAIYYLACFACGVLVRVRPSWSAPVTLAESSVNVTALLLAVFAPMLSAADGDFSQLASYPQLLANFAISGSAATLAFYQSLYALPREWRTQARARW